MLITRHVPDLEQEFNLGERTQWTVVYWKQLCEIPSSAPAGISQQFLALRCTFNFWNLKLLMAAYITGRALMLVGMRCSWAALRQSRVKGNRGKPWMRMWVLRHCSAWPLTSEWKVENEKDISLRKLSIMVPLLSSSQHIISLTLDNMFWHINS